MPISNKQREQVIELHGQGLSRNEIVRQSGVSAGSVTSICKTAGLSFDRASIEKATEGRRIDAKALRASLAADALNVAHEAQEALRRIVSEGSNIPPRDLATIYGIFMDKHIALAKLDQGNDTTATDSVVDQLLEGFKKQAGR